MRLSDTQCWSKQILVQKALKAPDGSWPPDEQIFKILDGASIIARIERFVLQRFQGEINRRERGRDPQSPDRADPKWNADRHPTEFMSADEQFEVQKRDLYDRSMGGDTQAKKLWFELHEERMQGMEFNVNVNVTPYTIADSSLKNIISAADRDVVREMLVGLEERMAIDEAPHELRDRLSDFARVFDEWAAVAYAPKDA